MHSAALLGAVVPERAGQDSCCPLWGSAPVLFPGLCIAALVQPGMGAWWLDVCRQVGHREASRSSSGFQERDERGQALSQGAAIA